MPNANESESADRGVGLPPQAPDPPPVRDEDLSDEERAEQDRRIDAAGRGRPWREVLADIANRRGPR